MKKIPQGFTLIELMIVVSIIGILASIAIPAYQMYTIRMQVAEGLNLSGPVKNAMVTFQEENGVFPTDNADAALEIASAYSGRYVESISVSGAVISITYGNNANIQIDGLSITLTATSNQGSTSWTCASDGFISVNYLPSSCL